MPSSARYHYFGSFCAPYCHQYHPSIIVIHPSKRTFLPLRSKLQRNLTENKDVLICCHRTFPPHTQKKEKHWTVVAGKRAKHNSEHKEREKRVKASEVNTLPMKKKKKVKRRREHMSKPQRGEQDK